MLKERRKVLALRIVCLLCAFILTIIAIVNFCKKSYGSSLVGFIFICIALIFLCASLIRNYKSYIYNGKKIIVYCGLYHHYLKVDGQIVDEEDTSIFFTTIFLNYNLDENIQAKISTCSSISIKINGILQRPTTFTD